MTDTVAPSNNESFGAFIEHYYASMNNANGAPSDNAGTKNVSIDLTVPYEPNLFATSTPFNKR